MTSKKCCACGAPLDEQFVKTGIRKETKLLQELDGLVKKARECGYALTVHGSMTRDIDLVAVPWTWHATSPEFLLDRLLEVEPQKIFQTKEQRELVNFKPHGRVCWVLNVAGENTYIDLSVFPPMERPNLEA